MVTAHGTIFMTHTTHGIITTDGVTDGLGGLGTAGTEAFGVGTAHTHGVTGDGDLDGITHRCTAGIMAVYTTSFLVS